MITKISKTASPKTPQKYTLKSKFLFFFTFMLINIFVRTFCYFSFFVHKTQKIILKVGYLRKLKNLLLVDWLPKRPISGRNRNFTYRLSKTPLSILLENRLSLATHSQLITSANSNPCPNLVGLSWIGFKVQPSKVRCSSVWLWLILLESFLERSKESIEGN